MNLLQAASPYTKHSLKGWEFHPNNGEHAFIYCFIRLDMRWKCLPEQPTYRNGFRTRLVNGDVRKPGEARILDGGRQSLHIFDEEAGDDRGEPTTCLPAGKRGETIMRLYFFQCGPTRLQNSQSSSTHLRPAHINAEVQKKSLGTKKGSMQMHKEPGAPIFRRRSTKDRTRRSIRK